MNIRRPLPLDWIVGYELSDATPMLLKAGWLKTAKKVTQQIELLDLISRSIKRHASISGLVR